MERGTDRAAARVSSGLSSDASISPYLIEEDMFDSYYSILVQKLSDSDHDIANTVK